MRLLYKYFLIILLAILLAICYVPIVSATHESSESQQPQLPFCDDDQTKQQTDKNAGLLYVSTLDGKISALDILNDGQKKWTINTTPGPMVSSSIQNLELTNNGQWVRMIPSLSGSMYKFDGETVEPIPITADNLLSSSYKYSDDLVISGGKETISYGVSAYSGQIIYECSMRGCINSTEIDVDPSDESELPPNDSSSTINSAPSPPEIDEDVIVVRRKTQTVRAIEARTGQERWNFSVGQHELESIRSSDDCHATSNSGANEMLRNLDVRVVVPEGIICAVRKNAPNVIVWKYKFDHPIVNVWKRDENNELKPIDLFQMVPEMWKFEGKSWTQSKDASKINDDDDEIAKVTPSIYIGMFKRQLYIQESEQVRSSQTNIIDHMIGDVAETKSFARIPWKPIDASNSGLAQIEYETTDDTSIVATTSNEERSLIKNNYSATAISVLYGSEYVNGNGFYLYSKHDDKSECEKEKTSNESDENIGFGINEPDFPEDGERFRPATLIKFVSLWYWWREIILIVLTILVFNVVLTQRRPNQSEVVIVERHVEIKVPATPEPIDNNFQLPTIEYHAKRSLSESNTSETEPEFKSRFQTDFDLLQCLGKGGFGVVFEVKNKIDDCNYAIKRIVLPKNKQSRERVMREVKTLANCEHHNIVRYFQAWVESPPPGWQEREDKIWMDLYAMSHSIEIDSPSVDEPSKSFASNAPKNGNVRSQLFNKTKLDFVIAGLQTDECVNFDDEIRKTNFKSNDKYNKNCDDDDDDDDSFIVFEAEENEGNKYSKAIGATNDISIESDASSDHDDEGSDRKLYSVFELSNQHQRKSLKMRKVLNKNYGMKKRSFSMTDSSAYVAKENKDCGIDMNLMNNACCVIPEKQLNGDKKRVPFKRTHRRPLSLDLTSTGSVRIPMSTNPVPSVSSMSFLYIQMQLCRKESLKDWLFENDSHVRAEESHGIFKQIVEAVEYVHLKGLIHRDLKPSNIFFSLDGRIKIGDFGLVTDMSENLKSRTPCGNDESGLPSCAKHTEQVGTAIYMSPEQLHGRPYNYKVDIYSLGLILFELLMVFNTEMERIATIKRLRSNIFPDEFPEKFQHEYNLLKLMLSKIPEERPTTYGIRARPPFSEPTDDLYHFTLPPRRRDSRSFSTSLSSSTSLSNSSSSNIKSSNK